MSQMSENLAQAVGLDMKELSLTLDNLMPMFNLKPLGPSDAWAISTSANTTIYTHIFGFESLFRPEYADAMSQWMTRNWIWSVYIAAAYIVLVILGRWAMRSRTKFDLRTPLVIWSVMLAAFSIFGSVRVLPHFFQKLTESGVVHSVCDKDYVHGITGFWLFMFVMSKLPELVDTMFIVLRKQELIFLHWYHHATVLVYCWYSYKDLTASGLWFMSMNYFVHALMYSYYALKVKHLSPLCLYHIRSTNSYFE